MTIPLLWLQLAGAAVIILVAATFLAKSADIISFKTGLGRSFAGVILLATATSLPELGTGVSSVTFVGEPDLAAGDAFGSNLFNLLIIALLDLFWRGGPILRSVSSTSTLVGALGIGVISLAGLAIVIHHATASVDGWFISPVSIVLIVVFMGALYMIFRADQSQEQTKSKEEEKGEDHQYASARLSGAVLTYAAAAAIVGGDRGMAGPHG